MLEIYTLGKSAFIQNGKALTFRTRKAEALLHYLVIIARPVDRTTLAELFWPDMTTTNAQKNLRATLPDLRHVLGEYLIVSHQEIAFNQQKEHWVDFYQLKQVMNASAGSIEEKFAQFLQLYQGDLLTGLNVTNTPEFESWLAQQTQQLHSKIAETLQQWGRLFLEQNAVKEGLAATQILLKLQPWDEAAHRLRMRLFWRGKQRSAALLQYNQCADYLEEELGIEPADETKKLYIQIQQEAIPLSAEKQDGSRLPESSAQPSKHNLTNKLTSFIGRQTELEKLTEYLLVRKHSLVSIIGEGGVGKTRLALAVASQIVADSASAIRYPDGVWFISCVGISAGETAEQQLIASIGTTIGLTFQGATPTLKQLMDYMHSRSTLLILDNFEHLLESTPLILQLVEGFPKLQILITSRHRLNIQSDLPLQLEGVAIPQFGQKDIDDVLTPEELSRLLAVSSVQILQDRAIRNWVDFTIDERNGVVVANLCQLLDGNPLALELAAHLVVNFDLATLYNELTRNYTLLAADLQDLPFRQRSIYNTIDYSWRLLPPDLATLLAQFSTFHGIFSQQATAAITDALPRHLTQLVHRSLLHVDEQRHFHIHEMVRQFAEQKLAQDEVLQLATQQRHSDYYIRLLSEWQHETQRKPIVAQLLPHLDNIYAALEWAFEHGSFERFSRSIIPFTEFHAYAGLIWNLNHLVNTYYQKLQEKLANSKADDAGSSLQEISTALTYANGILKIWFNDLVQGEVLLQQAMAQIQQHGYWYLAASTERYLGVTCRWNQRFEEARQHFQQALHYAQEQQQTDIRISTLISLAISANLQGRFTEGEDYLQQTLQLLQQYPEIHFESVYYRTYGDMCHAQGHWTKALEALQRAIEISSQQKKPAEEYHKIGKLLWQSGRYEQSKEYLERVDGASQNYIYRPGTYWHTEWLIDFANLYTAWQQPEQALFYGQLAREHAQKQGHKVLLGRAQKVEGAAQLQLEQWDAATQNLTQALALFRETNAQDHACAALTQLLQLHLTLEDEAEIRTYSEDIWQLLHSGKLDMTNAEPIKAWWACYLSLRALGDARAETAFHSALELFQAQQAQIEDKAWQKDFSTQITEHRDLLRASQAPLSFTAID